jgi:hypothetical protein
MKHTTNRGVSFSLGVALLISVLDQSVAPAQDGPQGARFAGTVVETTNASSYTYVLIDTAKEKVWAAAPQFDVKVGDKVSFSDGMAMQGFESKALHRKFDVVYFVGSIETPGAEKDANPGHGHGGGAIPNDEVHAGVPRAATAVGASAPKLDFSGLKKADGGVTVQELYEQKAKLEKKEVTFRGKVVKYNAQVMNKNWLHVQDGTGAPGTNDITVTTTDTAHLGETVLVRGTVVLNKDFGYGYKYSLMVENAKVSVESTK